MSTTFFGGYDGLLCDLDGVVYSGNSLIPGAEAIAELIDRGVRVGFVTNNASKAPSQVGEKLRGLGLDAVTDDMVHTSAQAGVALLGDHVSEGSKVLVVGSDTLAQAVREAGFAIVDRAADAPDAVIQGFSPTTGWERLAEASFAIGTGGAMWLATNLDLSIPQEQGRAPGNGSFVQAISNATGRTPDAVAGKPEPALFRTAATRAGMTRPLMVGDRLDTDIRGGLAAGYDAALVLTGIHGAEELAAAGPDEQPQWVLNRLTDLLGEPTPAQQVRGGQK